LEIARAAVVGAGLMGHGIAQIVAQVGKFEVYLTDVKQEFLDGGLKMIDDSLGRFVRKGELSLNELAEIKGRIHPTLSLEEAVQEADIVVEAAPEDVQLKRRLLSQIDKIAPQHTIMTSNTSSISITLLAKATKRPEKLCGMHFFNPPQLMKLVEIVRGAKTSSETIQTVKEFAQRLGKDPIIVKKDVPGFVVNRILVPALNEAIFLVQDDVADPADIDKAIQLGLNWPMGPLRLVDYIGLDTTLAMAKILAKDTAEPKKAISTLLRRMVKEGKLGRKAGKGFYDWSEKR
jgi:3-hydroxybutyryl-CoA dehydrogenase